MRRCVSNQGGEDVCKVFGELIARGTDEGHNRAKRTSCLWIFGSPYSSGTFPAEDRRRKYREGTIAPDLFSSSNWLFIRLSKAGVGSLRSFLYVF